MTLKEPSITVCSLTKKEARERDKQNLAVWQRQTQKDYIGYQKQQITQNRRFLFNSIAIPGYYLLGCITVPPWEKVFMIKGENSPDLSKVKKAFLWQVPDTAIYKSTSSNPETGLRIHIFAMPGPDQEFK